MATDYKIVVVPESIECPPVFGTTTTMCVCVCVCVCVISDHKNLPSMYRV